MIRIDMWRGSTVCGHITVRNATMIQKDEIVVGRRLTRRGG